MRLHNSNPSQDSFSPSSEFVDNDFYFSPGWALKQNQKFGTKGRTRIAKKVVQLMKGYFHSGNANRCDRYTAERMLSELQALAVPGKELYGVALPKIQTIKNWITRYAAECKEEMAEITLQRINSNIPSNIPL